MTASKEACMQLDGFTVELGHTDYYYSRQLVHCNWVAEVLNHRDTLWCTTTM